MCFLLCVCFIFASCLLHTQDVIAATINGNPTEANIAGDGILEITGDVGCKDNSLRCGDGVRNTTAYEPLAPRHKRSSACGLPPQPDHGAYTEAPYPAAFPPGLDIKILEYTCFPPYRLVGKSPIFCNNGQWTGTFPTCKLFCKLARYYDMDFRCLVSEDPADGYTKCDYLIPSGAKVQPFCKVHYYSRVPLNIMTCVNRTWDYMPDTCRPECGTVIPKGTPLMSGGRPAKHGELPWHVGVYYKKNKPYEQICGGSIISRKVVLSAAHCFWKLEAMEPPCRYAVQAGKLFRDWNDEQDEEVQQRDVIDIKIPPHYRGVQTNFQYDLAIVILEKSLFFKMLVQPVCLDFGPEMDKRHLKPGSMGKVAGWGYTSEAGEPSPYLKVADLPSVGIQQCLNETSFAFKVYITVDKICAGYTNGTATVCKGDSGGGLSFPEQENGVTKYYLRGIVSTAPADGLTCNTITLTTFTHVASHNNFIKSYFENSDRLGFRHLNAKMIAFYNDTSVCFD
ncbi:modular serine protease-like isoform X1 [Spodoptera frugiperda]|uniref:Modular serine protease-like isoform X1 n=1 Tax=Spodoptera frugiperda TaxID=7108 RepID=A0A9R0E5Y0_SPOFR|nr:modular serine protease-like isoform X1 [Spodoptera frugiperda]